MRLLRKTILILAMSLNVLAAAYYIWAAASGGLTSHAFSSEAMPFTLLYLGRGLTPIFAVIALVSLSVQAKPNQLV